MTLRIVATADNHLGRYHARMPVRLLDQRRSRLRRAFGQAVDHAIETRAHLLLIGGDLFDNPNPRNPDRVFLARCLSRLKEANVQVVAIGGNHDVPRSSTEEGGYPPLAIYQELDALHFLDELNAERRVSPITFEFDRMKVAIGGFTPNTNLPVDQDPLQGLSFEDKGVDFRVLLVHFGIEGTIYPGSEAIIQRETLKNLRSVDLVIAGNVHSYESFRAGETRVVIPGATEWMTFGEGRTVTPGFAEIEVDGREQVRVRQIKVEPQPRVEMTIKASDLDAEDPTGSVLQHLASHANKGALARLTLEGSLKRDTYARLNLSVVEDRVRELFFFCELDLSDLRVQFEDGRVRMSVVRRSVTEEIDQTVSRFLRDVDNEREREALEITRQEIHTRWRQLEQ